MTKSESTFFFEKLNPLLNHWATNPLLGPGPITRRRIASGGVRVQASVRASPSGQELAHATQTQPLLSVSPPPSVPSPPRSPPIRPDQQAPSTRPEQARRRRRWRCDGRSSDRPRSPPTARSYPSPFSSVSSTFRSVGSTSWEIRNPARELGLASGRRSRSLGVLWL